MNKDDHVMSMSEVQKLTGLSARTLQYYDDKGYLRVGRDQHGYRVYTEYDLQKLFVIVLLKEMGFNLEEIARLQRKESNVFKEVFDTLQGKKVHLNRLIDLIKLLSEINGNQIGFQLFNPKRINEELETIINDLKNTRQTKTKIRKERSS